MKACPEIQIDYSYYAECSKVNNIIVGLKLGHVNVNNTVCRCIFFVNNPISYAMSMSYATGQSLVLLKIKEYLVISKYNSIHFRDAWQTFFLLHFESVFFLKIYYNVR